MTTSLGAASSSFGLLYVSFANGGGWDVGFVG